MDTIAEIEINMSEPACKDRCKCGDAGGEYTNINVGEYF